MSAMPSRSLSVLPPELLLEELLLEPPQAASMRVSKSKPSDFLDGKSSVRNVMANVRIVSIVRVLARRAMSRCSRGSHWLCLCESPPELRAAVRSVRG